LNHRAADSNPQFHHVLSNAVGAGQEKLRADVSRVALFKGDVLLLCTDGLTGHLTDGELRLALSAEGDPTEASAALIEAAKARGGNDNVTAIVARVDD
jgi:protein phosphatase